MSQPRVLLQQSVLFIDDQTRFENIIRGGLLSYPAEYEFCPSRISTALERFRGQVPDLIVSAVEFSDGNFLDLVRETHGFLEKVPAICISEPHLADLEAKIAASGPFAWVDRSAEPLALVRKIAQVIAENIERERPAPFRPETLRPATGPTKAQTQADWVESILKKIK